MDLTEVLCSVFCCNMDELQKELDSRCGRYKASQAIKKFEFSVRGSESLYEFTGFARLEKLPTINEEGVLHFVSLPDILLKQIQTRRSSTRPFLIHKVSCRM